MAGTLTGPVDRTIPHFAVCFNSSHTLRFLRLGKRVFLGSLVGLIDFGFFLFVGCPGLMGSQLSLAPASVGVQNRSRNGIGRLIVILRVYKGLDVRFFCFDASVLLWVGVGASCCLRSGRQQGECKLRSNSHSGDLQKATCIMLSYASD